LKRSNKIREDTRESVVILSFLTTPCRAASAGHAVSSQKKEEEDSSREEEKAVLLPREE